MVPRRNPNTNHNTAVTQNGNQSFHEIATEGENELLKNFTVTHTDFIRQNMSNIYQYYKILHPPLGKGAFGEVRKAIHQMSNIPYAIKFIPVKNRDNDD
mmetsp:Transcript_27354/g.24125  ORF Transcript_27354/g.24125 Transcript_27354/m.24125 type:complete len:99 (-) Transcript_27354:23-319(-)|eukprot:CAMPEP_0114584252 /NCGR_PEP_ID=MMETSP0125-20121206/7973_1 /TAXON_ID=485358 ORGANISM="Aristerostoma sp., Strain ATCC 50986" /NCGR_SAMPLE_ID=MMETSP0125 /ASSEMBLY_ACC=CAM_ASM_000245 /LENGTH=98 /DNA_ID=CAMNT_0001778499 /DNA_START=30 /DNA_END=326 /DNA_ORIENTATION=+